MTTPANGADSARRRTLAEKVWDDHLVVKGENGEPDLIYIDLHLVHEVTSPQAFDGLRGEGRPLRRPDLTIATEDHNTPTLQIDKPIADLTSRTQIDAAVDAYTLTSFTTVEDVAGLLEALQR